MTQPNLGFREITRQLVCAFNRHDLGGVMSFFADDAIFEDGLGNTLKGRDEMRSSFFTLPSEECGQIDFQSEDYFSEIETDKVTPSWSLEIDIGGQRKRMRGLDILIFEGDKICSKSASCKGFGYKLNEV